MTHTKITNIGIIAALFLALGATKCSKKSTPKALKNKRSNAAQVISTAGKGGNGGKNSNQMLHELIKTDETALAIQRIEQSDSTKLNAQDKKGRTPLHVAAKNGYYSVVKKLIEAGVELNAQDNNKQTPLHLAAANGNESVVDALLMEEKVKLDIQDYNKQTPLHLAVAKGWPNIVQALIDARAKLYTRDSNKKTPLELNKNKKVSAAIEALLSDAMKAQ